LLFSILFVGCGKAGPELYPVEGKVTMNGQAPEGATVVLVPSSGTIEVANQPTGVVSSDGTFKLQTYPHGEGALPGDYKVLVTWLPPDARKQEKPINKAPVKYADPKTTPLSATIKEGQNTLPEFQLTK
jgi:hypothetical protein